MFFRRIRKEIEDLRAEVQELRNQLADREQDLEPCIGFVIDHPDEYESGVCRKGRRVTPEVKA